LNQHEVLTHLVEQFVEKNCICYLETSAKNSEKLFQKIAEELTVKARKSPMSVSNNSDTFPYENQ
jgi:hypothetical protein